jgi:hypothetical protein
MTSSRSSDIARAVSRSNAEAAGATIWCLDYRFFEQLTATEAEAYLATFLEEERKRISPRWWDRLMADGVGAIEPYFAEFVAKVSLVQAAPPDDLPEYIVEAMEREHGGFPDFATDADRNAALAAAFYFGEAFRRSFPSLSWTVGRADRAEQGQPVLTGFKTDADLPVLVVTENLALGYEPDPDAVATAIASWRRAV